MEKLIMLQAADIVRVILDHGKLKPPDIMIQLSVYEPKSTSFSLVIEIIQQPTSLEIKQYSSALHKLVSGTYLKPSTILSHLSPRDKCIQYEAEEKRKIVGFPTAKELREAKDVAQARLKREEEEAEQVGLVSQ